MLIRCLLSLILKELMDNSLFFSKLIFHKAIVYKEIFKMPQNVQNRYPGSVTTSTRWASFTLSIKVTTAQSDQGGDKWRIQYPRSINSCRQVACAVARTSQRPRSFHLGCALHFHVGHFSFLYELPPPLSQSGPCIDFKWIWESHSLTSGAGVLVTKLSCFLRQYLDGIALNLPPTDPTYFAMHNNA